MTNQNPQPSASPCLFVPIYDCQGREIKLGQTVQCLTDNALHKVEKHPAGFLCFVRPDGKHTHNAKKYKSGSYGSGGRFKSEKWKIISPLSNP